VKLQQSQYRSALQRGSAFSEVILSLLVLIPAFWAVDHLGRLAEIQRDTTMGARYAVWQNLATPPGEAIRDNVVTEVRDRIHGNVLAPIVAIETIEQDGYSHNALREGGRKTLVADTEAGGIRARNLRSEEAGRLSGDGPGAALLAQGRFMPAGVRLAGLSSDMLGLADAPLVAHEQSVTLSLDDVPGHPDTDSSAPQITASAALLTESWAAQSDREYQRRTNRIVASQPVDVFTRPARFIGRFPVFREGRYAAGTDFVPPSVVH